MFRRLANGWKPGSPAAKLRQKRFSFFLSLLNRLPEPADILDIGGQEIFWKIVGTDHPQIRSITLLNLWKEPVSLPKLDSVVGDARQLTDFPDQSVDVIFSNSVIEHVGGLREQQRAAREIRRVGPALLCPDAQSPFSAGASFPFSVFSISSAGNPGTITPLLHPGMVETATRVFRSARGGGIHSPALFGGTAVSFSRGRRLSRAIRRIEQILCRPWGLGLMYPAANLSMFYHFSEARPSCMYGIPTSRIPQTPVILMR